MRLSSRPATARKTTRGPREKLNAIKANALIPRRTAHLPASVPTTGTNPANNRYFAVLVPTQSGNERESFRGKGAKI